MKLQSSVLLNDGYYWKCVDVQHVIQHPNVLPIYTLTNGISDIRLTANEIRMNSHE